MIYLTAIALSPGGSSTIHIYTQAIHRTKQTIHRTTHYQHKQYTEQHIIDTKQYIEQHNSLIRKSVDRAPSLRGIPWHLPYNWREKARKNLSQGSRRMPVGTMKTEYTEQSIHNNKNT